MQKHTFILQGMAGFFYKDMKKICVLSVVVFFGTCIFSILPTHVAQAATLWSENFNDGIVSDWVMNKGSTASYSGSVLSGGGYGGTQGLRINYDFPAGAGPNVYLDSKITLPTSVGYTAKRIKFRIKNPVTVDIHLIVWDENQAVYYYKGPRPLYATDANQWYEMSIDLNEKTIGFSNKLGSKKVKALSIRILPKDTVATRGDVYIDDVSLDDSLVSYIDPHVSVVSPQTAVTPYTEMMGVVMKPYLYSTSFATRLKNDVKHKWVRTDLVWDERERQSGVYNWTIVDTMANDALAANQKILLILAYNNPLYYSSAFSGYDNKYSPIVTNTLTQFGNYANAAARHFTAKGNVAFEIWNEPDGSGFWKPSASASDYAQLVWSAAPKIRSASPTVEIVSGGISTVTNKKYLESFLASGTQSLPVNLVGVHSYINPWTSVSGRARWAAPPESGVTPLIEYRDVVKKYLPNARVVDTETGVTTNWFVDAAKNENGHSPGPRRLQAVYGIRHILTAWLTGHERFVWYNEKDPGTNPYDSEENFGLYTYDGQEKDVLKAVRQLASQFPAYQLEGVYNTAVTSVVAIKLVHTTTRDVQIILWNSYGEVDTTGWYVPHSNVYSVQTPAPREARDMLGNIIPFTVDAGGMVTWTLSEKSGPIYLVFNGLGGSFPPEVTFAASSTSIVAGEKTTLSWTSNYTTSCQSGNFVTDGKTRGSVTVQPLVSTTYSLNCVGGGGTVTAPPVHVEVFPPDTTAPQVSNISTFNVTKDSASILWRTDELATSKVRYGTVSSYENETEETTDVTTAHVVNLTGLTPNTTYRFSVVSRDAQGNTTASQDNLLTTLKEPDVIPPTVVITEPANGSVEGTIEVVAVASDDIGVSSVELIIDGVAFSKTTVSPYRFIVDTNMLADGAHELSALATDTSGNTKTSSSVQINVNNLNSTTPNDSVAPVFVMIGSSNISTSTNQQSYSIEFVTNEPTIGSVRYGTHPSRLSNEISSTYPSTEHELYLYNLDNKTRYYYQVFIEDVSGNKTNSKILSFKTRQISSSVRNLYAFSGSAQLRWELPQQERLEEIHIFRTLGTTSSKSRAKPLVKLSGVATSYTDKDVQVGTVYTYTLYTKSSGNDFSKPVSVIFKQEGTKLKTSTKGFQSIKEQQLLTRKQASVDALQKVGLSTPASVLFTGEVLESARLRTMPLLSGPIRAVLPKGLRVTVLKGPAAIVGTSWYYVRTPTGMTGWTVETNLKKVL